MYVSSCFSIHFVGGEGLIHVFTDVAILLVANLLLIVSYKSIILLYSFFNAYQTFLFYAIRMSSYMYLKILAYVQWGLTGTDYDNLKNLCCIVILPL